MQHVTSHQFEYESYSSSTGQEVVYRSNDTRYSRLLSIQLVHPPDEKAGTSTRTIHIGSVSFSLTLASVAFSSALLPLLLLLGLFLVTIVGIHEPQKECAHSNTKRQQSAHHLCCAALPCATSTPSWFLLLCAALCCNYPALLLTQPVDGYPLRSNTG